LKNWKSIENTIAPVRRLTFSLCDVVYYFGTVGERGYASGFLLDMTPGFRLYPERFYPDREYMEEFTIESVQTDGTP